MTDNISIKRIAKLHPKIRAEVPDILSEIQSKGVSIRVTQGLRTIQEQNDIFAIGRTTPGKIVSNAKGGSSFHNYGLALDFCLLHSDGSVSFNMAEDLNHDKVADWMQVVSVFKSHGWEWGDRGYVDTPHVQKVFGHKPVELHQMVIDGKVDKEGYVLI